METAILICIIYVWSDCPLYHTSALNLNPHHCNLAFKKQGYVTSTCYCYPCCETVALFGPFFSLPSFLANHGPPKKKERKKKDHKRLRFHSYCYPTSPITTFPLSLYLTFHPFILSWFIMVTNIITQDCMPPLTIWKG